MIHEKLWCWCSLSSFSAKITIGCFCSYAWKFVRDDDKGTIFERGQKQRNILSFEGKWLQWIWLSFRFRTLYFHMIIIKPPYFPILIVIFSYDDRPWLIVDNYQSQRNILAERKILFATSSPQANGPISSNIPSFLHWLTLLPFRTDYCEWWT